jgi:hypothetical protein
MTLYAVFVICGVLATALFLLQLNNGQKLEGALIRSRAVTILRAFGFRGHFRGHEFTAVLLSVHIIKRDGDWGQNQGCQDIDADS